VLPSGVAARLLYFKVKAGSRTCGSVIPHFQLGLPKGRGAVVSTAVR
jgi:hypothetical protein